MSIFEINVESKLWSLFLKTYELFITGLKLPSQVMKLCGESMLNSKLVKAASQKPKWNTVIEPRITEGAGGKKYFLWSPPPEWSSELEFHSTDLIKGGNIETQVHMQMKTNTWCYGLQMSVGWKWWCCSQVMLKQMACELQQVPEEQNEWNLLLPWGSQLELDLSLIQLHFLLFTGIQIQGSLCSHL